MQELKGQVIRLQSDLDDLATRSVQRQRQGRGGVSITGDREVQPGHKVPQAVYRVLYYLEARRIQRNRAQQARVGTFHQATARDWRKYLYRMVRQRVHFYLKEKEFQRRRAVEREGEFAEETDALVLWNRQGDSREMEENPLVGTIREPKKNRGNVEYKRRKKQAKKLRKKQRKAEAKAEATGAILAESTSARGAVEASQPWD